MLKRMEHFKRGTLKTLILFQLKNGSKGIYDLKKSIKDMSMGFYVPSTGVIYPNLKNLINDGLIIEKTVDGKKKYYITDSGKKYLDENMKKWKEIMEIKIKKFERMEEIGTLIKKIAEKIVAMNEADLEEKRDKIIEILNESLKKIEEL